MENLKKLFEICNLEPMVIIHDFGGNYEYVRAKRTNEYIIVTFKRDNITVMVFKDIQTMEVTFISLGIKEFICPMAKCPMLDLIVAEKNRR